MDETASATVTQVLLLHVLMLLRPLQLQLLNTPASCNNDTETASVLVPRNVPMSTAGGVATVTSNAPVATVDIPVVGTAHYSRIA